MNLDLRRRLEIWRQNKCNENSSGWYCKICKRSLSIFSTMEFFKGCFDKKEFEWSRERINLANLKFPLQSPCKEDQRIEVGFEETSRNMEAEQV